MRNLRRVAEESKGATPLHPLSLYYDYQTDEALTDSILSESNHVKIMKCTELIRECSEQEIESYIWRALWM